MRRYETPTFGTVDLEKHHTLHERLGHFDDWLEETCDREKPDGIAWEGARLMPHDKLLTLLLLYGLIAHARRIVWRRKLAWCEVPIPDVKAALLGNAQPLPKGLTHSERSKLAKDRMIHAASETMGWEVEDHHQADAGGVGLVAYDNLWPRSG